MSTITSSTRKRSLHPSAPRSGPPVRLVILDFERIPGQTRAWVMGHVRSDRDTVIEEIEAAGFVLTETLDVEGLIENYMLRFTKL